MAAHGSRAPELAARAQGGTTQSSSITARHLPESHPPIALTPIDHHITVSLSLNFLIDSKPQAPLVIMSDVLLKAEKDFTKDADSLIPEAEALAKV